VSWFDRMLGSMRDWDPRRLRKIGVGVLLGFILFLLPLPAGLSVEGKDALALFLLIIYFWATEALPLPVTALGAGVGLVLTGVVENSNQAWTPYAQDTIFLLLGALILADAVTKTGMDRVLAAKFLHRLGGSTDMLLLGIVVISTLSAMIVSSHAIAAVMLPLVLTILRSTGLTERKNIAAAYMLAIAFGTGIAGLATPSSGGRNAIVLGYLDELYDVQISYLDWTLRAAPITIVLIPITYFILKLVFRVPHEKLDKESIDIGSERMDLNKWLTLIILAATVFLWITVSDDWGLGTVAIMGAIALFIFGILDWVDTRKRIAWGVPLIYGAALTMGQALQDTGAAQWLAGTVLDFGSNPSTLVITTVVLVFTVALTQIMSDGGTAAVVAPVTLSLAAIVGYPLAEMGMLTAMAAAFSFILVVGTPPNVITYSSGLFTAKDLAKAGLPLVIFGMVTTWFAVTFYWPMLG
jgi:sodium-dependent dicarboxylate transporter 2/3/5